MFKKIKDFLFTASKQTTEKDEEPVYSVTPTPPKAPTPLWLVLTNTLLPTLCAVAYVVVGLVSHIWHPTWLMFFLIPIYYSLFECIEKKNMNYFAYPVLAVGVYLLLGFLNTRYFATT